MTMHARPAAASEPDWRSEHEQLFTQIDTLSSARIPKEERAAFQTFLRRYYEAAPLDALKQRTLDALFEIASAHWRFAHRRAPRETLIRVSPPPPPAEGRPALAAVQTCVEDQAFLVDTITLCIRAAGASIDWTVHPVMSVRRDARGDLESAGDAGAGVAESWIHVEFEPLTAEGAYAKLEAELARVLGDLRRVVDGYAEIRRRVGALIETLGTVPARADAAEFAEARAFLEYLDDHHFTFLGYVESVAQPMAGGHIGFRTSSESGLGLLHPDSPFAMEGLIAPQAELDKYAESPRLVVITKANLRSPVHRNELMDVISVKRFDAAGNVAGTVRLLGLFATEVYVDRPRDIPVIRRKAEYVLRRSRLAENSHSAKNLRDILQGLPRDELFQSSEEELFRLCTGIRALRDRHHLRLFVRRDRYGRFFSCLVYLPRDRYSRELRDRVGALLMEMYGGTAVDRTVEFLRSGHTRVHYIVRTPPGTTTQLTPSEVEARLIAATRSWREQMRDILTRDGGDDTVARFADAFPLAYQASVSPLEAAEDVSLLARLTPSRPVLPRLYVEQAEGAAMPRAVRLKLYALHNPITLSDVLPTLENFGFAVIRQEPAEVTPKDGPSLWIQEFDISHPGCNLAPDSQRTFFEAAFLQVWRGEVENDGLNRLVLGAGLTARQVTLLRTICKYLLQTGLPYDVPFMEGVLSAQPELARQLVKAFETRFSPKLQDEQRKTRELKLAQSLDHALDQVESLDADRVLRACLSVIRAALRTNYFQTQGSGQASGQPKHYVSIKIDPAKIPELPLPRPLFEIWVYAPEVEGIHLRGGRVARGGLRWSDRRADFRTEILGLMKAQMVKNAVIVPVGAKGGFVVKRGPAPSERDAWLANGIECYKTFLRGLLDITDNLVGGAIVPPADVVRRDEDDPYLVVAADKGTATFSDIANGLSAEYGFWLGDAFASGGSAGYDHKKMGITARGAWESVKRHFREISWTDEAGAVHAGKDIQNEAFTAVGIGDMSGDVFGNGMLLSRKLKLVAAFDHRHIFLDPDPDPDKSFDERQRLFNLPRSSWADYSVALISPGGGVFPRSAKQIKLGEEVRKLLGITATGLTPAELIKAILKAPVDLLWNGGIGTYVKASTQTHLDVGDRGNDAVRVNGRELRCKVVGEGGNLGFTQLARIEYALHGGDGKGGRINTDAIDNAGGVRTSDREVNIKIPLNQLASEGKLTRQERDPLLAELTSEVARAVLRDNYVQSAAISLLEAQAAERLDDHAELIRLLERDGLLNRALEFLPDDETLKERRMHGTGLTRPELAVLVAYSKISLFDAILKSDVPDDPFFDHDLLSYFPVRLVTRFRDAYAKHRLKREIIATILANALVNRMGAPFAQLWAENHGLTRAEVIKAYATAHLIYDGDAYWTAIEALDNKVPAALQYRMMNAAIGLLRHVTGWLTASQYASRPVQDAVDRFAGPVGELGRLLPDVLPPSYREDWRRAIEQLRSDGVPDDLAMRLVNTRALGSAPDIAELAEEAGASLADAAGVYYLSGERFHMLWIYAAINDLPVSGKWQALARVNLRDDAYRIHRQLAGRVLRTPGATPQARFDAWAQANERRVKLGLARLAELQTANTREFTTLAVAVREIRKLRLL
jgi:glutamate dehydrogenase